MSERVVRRVPSAGGPVYAFDPRPGCSTFAVLVSPEEYDFVFGRGYATLDGVRADVVAADCDRSCGFLRLRLVEPYAAPKLRLAVAA